MTREIAKQNLELITAFANGETIQYLDYLGEWADADSPSFVLQGRYRVKPKRVLGLYNPASNPVSNYCETNLDRFSKARINDMLSRGWVMVELVQVPD